MTLLRAGARTMLASYFIVNGVKTVRNPDPLVPAAEPVADRVVPLVKKYAPQQVATVVPEDTASLVRANGAAQVLGGLALASGKGRRLGALLLAGSLVPSTLAKHPFWTRTDPEERALDRSQFLKNVSLLGSVLLAAGDTEGRPSLAYRAQKGGHSIAKETRKARKSLAKSTSGLAKSTTGVADEALAGGAALVGAVVASSRAAKKKAAKELKYARQLAAKEAAELREAAEKAAKNAKKHQRKQQKKARRRDKHIRRGEN
jgi:uncharacterized membrane protein YphA (DoxX/SURF4 family)